MRRETSGKTPVVKAISLSTLSSGSNVALQNFVDLNAYRPMLSSWSQQNMTEFFVEENHATYWLLTILIKLVCLKWL
jgi:hypothetical protein